jgi:tRNA modification GTPase
VELVDTAGVQEAANEIESQAQSLGRTETERADLLLVCVECGQTPDAKEEALLARPEALGVATKSDLGGVPSGWLAVSAVRGTGLEELRQVIGERAEAQRQPALAPSLSRCRHHVEACIRHLRQAHSVVLFGEPPELLALELRGALDQLGEMVGAVYTDDLLDRIFTRFCIGK